MNHERMKKKIKWEIFDKRPLNFSTRKRNPEKRNPDLGSNDQAQSNESLMKKIGNQQL
jgi:hypothetical protein